MQIRHPSDVLNYIKIANKKWEHFGVILLNGNHEIIKNKVLFVGGLSAATVDLRVVFYTAIKNLASGIIVYHNHPSGNCEPSKQDLETTKRLKDAGKLLGIQLLDHVIVGKGNYMSFMEYDLLEEK